MATKITFISAQHGCQSHTEFLLNMAAKVTQNFCSTSRPKPLEFLLNMAAKVTEFLLNTASYAILHDLYGFHKLSEISFNMACTHLKRLKSSLNNWPEIHVHFLLSYSTHLLSAVGCSLVALVAPCV